MTACRMLLILLTVAVLSACGASKDPQASEVTQPSVTEQAVAPAMTAGAIQVVTVVPFANGLQVRDAVRNECNIGGKLSDFTKSFGDAYKLNVVQVDTPDPSKGPVLTLEITDVVGTGGGSWSGSKSVSVRGQLTDNGAVIGSFTGSRASGGGAFGAYKGTCSILGRCSKTLGKDIANWLRKPTMNAVLGNG